MAPERNTQSERCKRAGEAVAARILELHTSVAKVAIKAGIAETTLRALIRGTRWPHRDTRLRINAALDWPPGEIMRRATATTEPNYERWVRVVPTPVLIAEISRRCGAA